MQSTVSAILDHYKISSLTPDTWPAEKDAEDEVNNFDIDNDNELNPSASSTDLGYSLSGSRARGGGLSATQTSNRRSRYSILQQGTGGFSVPGAEKSAEGLDTLVQKDEPDPLGIIPGMVVATLEAKGMLRPENAKLRNRFLLSSTTFSPSLFLANVHREDSAQSLDRGLQYLSHSIEQKSASLKVLVESNFDRFVRAKATIDNVYAEMRGSNSQDESIASNRFSSSHRRQRSNTSYMYGANAGDMYNPRLSGRVNAQPVNKHALVRETEHGTLPLKNLLAEISIKCQELWGASLGGKAKEDLFKSLLSSIRKNRKCFELGISIDSCIKRRDYPALVDDYYAARDYATNAKITVDRAVDRGSDMTTEELHELLIVSRMWEDVSTQVENLKEELWRKVESGATGSDIDTIQAMRLLLELGVVENPIWVWLRRRLTYLEQKVVSATERGRLEIEVLRRRLMVGGPRSKAEKAKCLRQALLRRHVNVAAVDSPEILDFWEALVGFCAALFGPSDSLLAEIITFWNDADGVITGRTQRDFPNGYRDESIKHHTFGNAAVQQLRGGATDLIRVIIDSILKLFQDPPPEDVSMLYSPAPSGLTSPVSAAPLTSPVTPQFASLSAMVAASFPPKLSRKQDHGADAASGYAFWPPSGMTLGGTHFLPRILGQLVTGSDSAIRLPNMKLGPNALSEGDFRALILAVRGRATMALCDAWQSDIQACRALEDWARNPDAAEITQLPTRFMLFESNVLMGLQRVMYLSESLAKSQTEGLVRPPPVSLVNLVHKSFSDGLCALVRGMVENVTDPASGDLREKDLVVPAHDLPAVAATERPVFDYSTKDTRLLLTHSNLKYLQYSVLPHLVTQLETHFHIHISSSSPEGAEIEQSIKSLFFGFITPYADLHRSIVLNGLLDPSWAPRSQPSKPQGYVYDLLLSFVAIHSSILSVTPHILTNVMIRLVERASESFVEAVQSRDSFDLNSLMQAMLDIEFFAQTLRSYTSEKAKETQGEIYIKMDKRTDDVWKTELKGELKRMEIILRQLREKTKVQFACFRKPRTQARGGKEEHRRG